MNEREGPPGLLREFDKHETRRERFKWKTDVSEPKVGGEQRARWVARTID